MHALGINESWYALFVIGRSFLWNDDMKDSHRNKIYKTTIANSKHSFKIKFWMAVTFGDVTWHYFRGSPDILLTKLLYYTKCQSRKREKSQLNIYRILTKVNQVIYTMGTVYMPNIMILAQAIIQIFCWQGSIGLQCVSQIFTEFHEKLIRSSTPWTQSMSQISLS